METVEGNITEGTAFLLKREIYAEMQTLSDFVRKSTDKELLREVYDEILDAQQKLGMAQQDLDSNTGFEND